MYFCGSIFDFFKSNGEKLGPVPASRPFGGAAVPAVAGQPLRAALLLTRNLEFSGQQPADRSKRPVVITPVIGDHNC